MSLLAFAGAPAAFAGENGEGEGKDKKKPDFPEFKEVSEDYTKVVSTVGSAQSMWTVWTREKDGQMLAELPRGYEKQKYFFAMTISAGDTWAGYQGGDIYVYWKRYDKRLALIAPNVGTRSSGDQESKSSVSRHFTDRVVLDVPIVAMGPGGGPVIDMDSLLLGNASSFFGYSARGINAKLASIIQAKAFPENIELAYEVPVNGGQLRTFHYSISQIPAKGSYKPRAADTRVGYFTTTHRDLGMYNNDKKWVRYINRWDLEKADPSRALSPPKQPIIFYLDHAVPVRYRRWVREGVLYWNKAFEEIGILDAVQVHYQDKTTGAHMDKDSEDVRYNFLMWLSNDISTAIGPSRVHPLTGQILDADIVLTDGWIRVFWSQYNRMLPDAAMEGFGPDTLAWLDRNPRWDPRLRLASPGDRQAILAARMSKGAQVAAGHPAAHADTTLIGDDEFDGLAGRVSQVNGMCLASQGKAQDMAMMRMALGLSGLIARPDGEEGEEGEEGEAGEESEENLLDGVPEWFAGPLLADLVAHEVGHTIGLRHNFTASSIYSMSEINSGDIKGDKAFTGSVMDYNPLNINMEDGEVQGDYAMIDLGPYDMWAIEYGYTTDDPKKVLERVAEPELRYLTDEDTWGPDPYARRYDFSADPLDYANSRMRLVEELRGKLLDKFVKEGETWARARQGYNLTISEQFRALSMMANWIGGAHVYRDKKGDPNGRTPLVPADVKMQRAALRFCIDNSFNDDAFGLTPELLAHMTLAKWWDAGGFSSIFDDPTWPVHDRILGLQAVVLTQLMNPTTLSRVYDNEFRIPSGEDALTLPELFSTISDSIWSELETAPDRRASAREPMVSSLRRNLQSEHLERLVDLTMPDPFGGASAKPVSNLAMANLRLLKDKIDGLNLDSTDPYTQAHLQEASIRISKALDAQYIYNTDKIGGSMPFFFGQTSETD
jgi:hypothetical protein